LPAPHDAFFLDNCLSPQLVEGLKVFGENVEHLRSSFPENTPDTIWIPEVARRGWILVTRDKRIRTRPLEIEALIRTGLPTFIFTQKNDPDMWGWVELIVKRWAEMKVFAASQRRPFIAGIPFKGKIERLR
jgi:PIN like domain